MAFIPTPDTARCELSYVVNGNPISNILNFRCETASPGLTELTALADAVDNWAETVLMPTMSDECTYQGTRTIDISAPNGLFVDRPSATPGLLNGAILPLNCAFVIKHTTSRVGRSYRGRTYIAPLREQDVVENTFDSLIAGDLITAFDTLRLNVFAAGWRFVILSYYANGAARLNGSTAAVTSSSVTSLRVDTRRKRLPSEN
jgi:hypothetical protein